MKNKILFLIIAAVFGSGTYDNIFAQVADISQFVNGKATVHGIITDTDTGNPIKTDIVLGTYNACMGSIDEYEAPVDAEGMFSVTVPVCHTQIAYLATPWGNIVIELVPDMDAFFSIEHRDDDIIVSSNVKSRLNEYDTLNMPYILMEIIMSNHFEANYGWTPDEYRQNLLNKTDEVLQTADSYTQLSDYGREILKNELYLFYMSLMLDYESRTKSKAEYLVETGKLDALPEEFIVPDIEYYTFLEDLRLNDSGIVSASYYPIIMETILEDGTLSIPFIGNGDPYQWMSDAKAMLSPLLGTDEGVFYDLLLANSYASQLKRMEPFLESQIAHIGDYFGGTGLYDILMAENSDVVSMLAIRSEQSKVTHIYGSEEITAECVINDIIAAHENKIIVLDYWATWCGPCISAIRAMKSLKTDYADKDVVFVYLAAATSVESQWERMKENIDGVHYYIHDEGIWDSLMGLYGFNAIPSYVIFGRDGNPVHTQTGYMGNEALSQIIDELLE